MQPGTHKKELPVDPRITDAGTGGIHGQGRTGHRSTRTNIIRTLVDRKYIRYSGKYIVPPEKALFIYETVRGMKMADASLTSGWETQLARIEQGNSTQEEFLNGVLETAMR